MRQLQLLILFFTTLLIGCRGDELKDEIIPATWTKVTQGVDGTKIKGFFLLNEGNMGSNKASLDYFDYETGYYMKNIFAELNPNIVKELGDVGNDINIYGDKLYAVINCSHFVEVMALSTAKHIGVISIPNCRNIIFHNGYAYVSSYAGPVAIDPNARLGYVAKIDTASLKVVGECTVGYQPEDMVVVNDKLYVANSGGYRVPNYDNTVSVIDLNTFTEIEKIEVAINLQRMEKDSRNNIYISSRGDYYNVPSRTMILDPISGSVSELCATLPNTNMTICDDFMYLHSSQWSYITNSNVITYGKVDLRTQKLVSERFITDGSDKKIAIPYGIAVNSESGEIFVTDATNYVTPGTLYCYDNEGVLKWQVETGDIPAHIVFTNKRLKTK